MKDKILKLIFVSMITCNIILLAIANCEKFYTVIIIFAVVSLLAIIMCSIMLIKKRMADGAIFIIDGVLAIWWISEFVGNKLIIRPLSGVLAWVVAFVYLVIKVNKRDKK
jgi:predicted membrane channel-forming protein YqfA (hemolysin III family)